MNSSRKRVLRAERNKKRNSKVVDVGQRGRMRLSDRPIQKGKRLSLVRSAVTY